MYIISANPNINAVTLIEATIANPLNLLGLTIITQNTEETKIYDKSLAKSMQGSMSE